MKKLVTILCLGTLLSGCSKMSAQEREDSINSVFRPLNENGVLYRGRIQGPTNAGFITSQHYTVGSNGFIDLEVESPRMNPRQLPLDHVEGTVIQTNE